MPNLEANEVRVATIYHVIFAEPSWLSDTHSILEIAIITLSAHSTLNQRLWIRCASFLKFSYYQGALQIPFSGLPSTFGSLQETA